MTQYNDCYVPLHYQLHHRRHYYYYYSLDYIKEN